MTETIEKPDHQFPIFAIGLILFSIIAVFGWIKLQYGFNFTDEGYLATESWRLAAGDHFLDDKITGALRHYTLINSFIFKIYPNISLLQLRQLQYIVTLAALLLFSIALFRQTRQYAWLPFVFSLFAFTGLEPVGMISNLYYQTYPHLFIVLFLSFMLFGFQSENPAIKKVLFVLSGLCLWLMNLSLLFLGLIIFSPIIIFILSRAFKLKYYHFTFNDLLYVISPFAICWVLFIAIYNKPYLLNLFNSIDVLLSLSIYSEGMININWDVIKHISITMIFLSLFLISIKKMPIQFFIPGCALLSLILFLMINTPFFDFLTRWYIGWFGKPRWFSSLLMSFTILFWIYTIRKIYFKKIFSKEEELSIILMIPFTICAFSMSIFSSMGLLAVCQTSIPAVAAISYCLSSQTKNLKYQNLITVVILILLLGPFYYATAIHDWDFTYADVPPKQADVRIETGFGKGIYTNYLYHKIYTWLIANSMAYTQPGEYAISYTLSPMVHMITKLRPSLDDTFFMFEINEEYYTKCITKMKVSNREPKIAFIFERVPQLFPVQVDAVRHAVTFPNKQFDFPSSQHPISKYIKTYMKPASTLKLSDNHLIRCYVNKNL